MMIDIAEREPLPNNLSRLRQLMKEYDDSIEYVKEVIQEHRRQERKMRDELKQIRLKIRELKERGEK